MYADDLLLMSSSIFNVQCMKGICAKFSLVKDNLWPCQV